MAGLIVVARMQPMWLFAALAMTLGAGCGPSTPSVVTSVTVEKPRSESSLAFITISKKAYASLGIQTTKAAARPVQERLALTGWIMARPGHEVTVTAPAAGYVRALNDRAPIAGARVTPGQELLTIEPVLAPVEQIQLAALKRAVESEFAKAKTTLQSATTEHQRVRDLHAQNLRSLQDLENAQKQLEHAREDHAAAQDKLKLFAPAPIPLRAPRAGAVLALHASPGQYVAAAAPVVTVIDLEAPCIRVPVPEFDLPHVSPQQSVSVTWKHALLERGAGPAWMTARPMGRVAQVDSERRTADFWYELEANKNMSAVKDQMVTVHVPTGKEQHATVVAYAALVFDASGQAWVYLERTADADKEHRFERRRVDLGAAVDNGIVVRAGVDDGAHVVTSGAAALFSREFHKAPVKDDDDD
jgi:RND family efflux transporter MFP subunit